MFIGAMLAAHPLIWALGLASPNLSVGASPCASARCIALGHLQEARDWDLSRIAWERDLVAGSVSRVALEVERPKAPAVVVEKVLLTGPAFAAPVPIAKQATPATEQEPS